MQDELAGIQGDFMLEESAGTPHLYMIGNDAIGLGSNLRRLKIYGCLSDYAGF